MPDATQGSALNCVSKCYLVLAIISVPRVTRNLVKIYVPFWKACRSESLLEIIQILNDLTGAKQFTYIYKCGVNSD